MSKYIATRAIRGANAIVAEAEAMLEQAIAEKGADTEVAFPNTAYYLPVMNGMLGAKDCQQYTYCKTLGFRRREVVCAPVGITQPEECWPGEHLGRNTLLDKGLQHTDILQPRRWGRRRQA